MSAWLRLTLLSLALAAMTYPVIRVAKSLPAFGVPTSRYGLVVNELGPPLRHVSNEVSAVNFDFRGLDTLGEEFMLVGAVTGAVLLLRGTRGEELRDEAGRTPGRATERRSDSTVLVSRVFGAATLLFGLYMILHATVSPGGGFQGGVVIGSGLLLLYLGEDYPTWRRLVNSRVLDALEGGGALLFALCGFIPMLVGGAYLQNVLPLGDVRSILSGGLMLVENAGVGLAVAGGFAMLFLEFMEETRARKEGDET